MRILLAICVLLSCATPMSAQSLSSEEREVLRLQDQRSLGEGKLQAYLSHSDSILRYRAAIALANIQDSTTVALLLPLLSDPFTMIRAAAAFALGEIGSRASESALLLHLYREPSETVFRRIAEAIGRCGGENGLDALVNFGTEGLPAGIKQSLAVGLFRYALRGIRSERSIWFAFDLTNEVDAETQWMALQTLWRLSPNRQIDVEIAKRRDTLARLAMNQSVDVRMNLATLLGRSRSNDSRDILLQLHAAERANPDWRVQVQIARSLAAHVSSDPALLITLVDYLKSSHPHVKIAGLLAIAGLAPQVVQQSEDRAELQKVLNTLSSAGDPDAELVQGEAIVALGRHFPDEFAKMDLLANPASTFRVRTKVIEAMSFSPTKANLHLLLQTLTADSVRIAMAAWDFVRRFFNPVALSQIQSQGGNWKQIGEEFYMKARSSLARGDMAIISLVATAIRDTSVFGFFRGTSFADSLVNALAAAYGKLSSPDDVEAMQAVLDALGEVGDKKVISLLEKALQDPDKTVASVAASALERVTGNDYTKKIPKATKPLYSNYDWKNLETIPIGQQVRIRTSKGDFVLRLLRNEAPFTVLNFVNLVRKGFYDGLTFHRVVPNFVVQGGDPRGDGWGGPGYAIRSEFSLADYQRGSVGIASAGKDTEGCQFFVTHSPQPHLNGRYSLFAEVVEGMSVVDRLQVGDKILEITLK